MSDAQKPCLNANPSYADAVSRFDTLWQSTSHHNNEEQIAQEMQRLIVLIESYEADHNTKSKDSR